MRQPFHGWPACAFAPAIAALLCSIATASASSAVWRCGNSYSDVPCPNAVRIDAPGGPSTDQQRQADEATRANQAAAQRMERERLQLEAAAVHRGATIIGEPPPKPSARHGNGVKSLSATTSKKSGKARRNTFGDDFVATGEAAVSKSGKKKSKAKAGD